jgi:putative SOS response-associated peptidase YedK
LKRPKKEYTVTIEQKVRAATRACPYGKGKKYMCGRFTLTGDIQTVAQAFHATVPSSLQATPRYNVAPTQNIVAVVNDGGRYLEMLRWGLIPSWAKDESIGSRMINARAETLAEKPSFKRLLHNRRCLIIADGFYEWAQQPGTKSKTPMYITLKDHEPFAFASLWDSWRTPNGQQMRTCTVITTEPNELMAPIHNRMPALLLSDALNSWLDPSVQDAQELLHLLRPYPTELMIARPVSRLVNNPKYDSAELIA